MSFKDSENKNDQPARHRCTIESTKRPINETLSAVNWVVFYLESILNRLIVTLLFCHIFDQASQKRFLITALYHHRNFEQRNPSIGRWHSVALHRYENLITPPRSIPVRLLLSTNNCYTQRCPVIDTTARTINETRSPISPMKSFHLQNRCATEQSRFYSPGVKRSSVIRARAQT